MHRNRNLPRLSAGEMQLATDALGTRTANLSGVA